MSWEENPRLSDFARNRSARGRDGKLLEETISDYAFGLALANESLPD